MSQYTTTMELKITPTLMIASSNLLMAELIKTINNEIPFEVICIITEGTELFEKIFEVHPDYLLIDSELENCNGLGFFKKLERIKINAKVIVYSFSKNPAYIKCFLSSKANAYIQNGCSLSEFKGCLKNISEGKRVIFSNINQNEEILHRYATQALPHFNFNLLTEREKVIWKLLAQEMTEREIADQLIISINTVKTHKNNISEKIGIKNKRRLTRVVNSMLTYNE